MTTAYYRSTISLKDLFDEGYPRHKIVRRDNTTLVSTWRDCTGGTIYDIDQIPNLLGVDTLFLEAPSPGFVPTFSFEGYQDFIFESLWLLSAIPGWMSQGGKRLIMIGKGSLKIGVPSDQSTWAYYGHLILSALGFPFISFLDGNFDGYDTHRFPVVGNPCHPCYMDFRFFDEGESFQAIAPIDIWSEDSRLRGRPGHRLMEGVTELWSPRITYANVSGGNWLLDGMFDIASTSPPKMRSIMTVAQWRNSEIVLLGNSSLFWPTISFPLGLNVDEVNELMVQINGQFIRNLAFSPVPTK